MISDFKAYFIDYRYDVPCGGWSDEYKIRKFVLMDIPEGSFMMGGSHLRPDGGCHSISGKAMSLWMIQVETLGPDWH